MSSAKACGVARIWASPRVGTSLYVYALLGGYFHRDAVLVKGKGVGSEISLDTICAYTVYMLIQTNDRSRGYRGNKDRRRHDRR